MKPALSKIWRQEAQVDSKSQVSGPQQKRDHILRKLLQSQCHKAHQKIKEADHSCIPTHFVTEASTLHRSVTQNALLQRML